MIFLLLVLSTLFCAFQVMRSARLLIATLWLALTSALVAVLIYMLGAPEVAVIELSVGAGLVTVLFVFAFSILGELTVDEITIVPRPLVWVLVLGIVLGLSWLILPTAAEALPVTSETLFADMLWQHRGLDVLAQMVLIFAGVMGLIGLLSETRPLANKSSAAPTHNLQAQAIPIEPEPDAQSVVTEETKP